MEPTITSEVVVAYSQCPRKAYLLLFRSDKGESHEYVRILEQERCVNQRRYVDRLKHKHPDVQPDVIHSSTEVSNLTPLDSGFPERMPL